MEDLIQQAIPDFVALLKKRLDSQIFTTEDSVRYTFFAALLRSGIQPEQIILEARYEGDINGELDMLLCDAAQLPTAALEFKYDRAIPSARNTPVTQKAGKIFADLRRLLLWRDSVARYFIYLTDPIMYAYLTNRSNPLADIFALSPNQARILHSDSFVKVAGTFQNTMGVWSQRAVIQGVVHEALPAGHHLWIFSIQAQETD